MSQPTPNPILDALGRTDAWLIAAVVAGMEIVDLGVVGATDQRTVDVSHAVIRRAAGAKLPATVTRGVEVLWPFPGTWSIAVGDVVLLLGAKDYVASAAGLAPAVTDVPLHYSQETMKAVPLYSGSKQAQLVVDAGNLFHLRNASTSLYAVLNNLLSALSAFATACSTATTVAQVAAAAATLATSMASVTTALGQILAA